MCIKVLVYETKVVLCMHLERVTIVDVKLSMHCSLICWHFAKMWYLHCHVLKVMLVKLKLLSVSYCIRHIG